MSHTRRPLQRINHTHIADIGTAPAQYAFVIPPNSCNWLSVHLLTLDTSCPRWKREQSRNQDRRRQEGFMEAGRFKAVSLEIISCTAGYNRFEQRSASIACDTGQVCPSPDSHRPAKQATDRIDATHVYHPVADPTARSKGTRPRFSCASIHVAHVTCLSLLPDESR